MTLNDFELPKLEFLENFFVIFGCDTHFKSELRWNGCRWTGQPVYDIFSIARTFLKI